MTSAIPSSVSLRYQSPLMRLQSELASEVSSGALSAGDQSPLSSALTDIDLALKGQASSGGNPGDVKSKIDSLIAGEVKDGKLTSAQAEELRGIFANAFQSAPQDAGGPGDGGSGNGGPRGAGGAPPGGKGGTGNAGGSSSSSDNSTDPADLNKDGTVTAAEQAQYDAMHPSAATSSSNWSGIPSSSSDSSTNSSNVSRVLADFLRSLQDSQGNSLGYSASGSTVATRIQSQVLDYRA